MERYLCDVNLLYANDDNSKRSCKHSTILLCDFSIYSVSSRRKLQTKNYTRKTLNGSNSNMKIMICTDIAVERFFF